MLRWTQDGNGAGSGDGTVVRGGGRVSAPPDIEIESGLTVLLDNGVMA